MLLQRVLRTSKLLSFPLFHIPAPLISGKIYLGTPSFNNSRVPSGFRFTTLFLIRNMSTSISSSAVERDTSSEILSGEEDKYDGVTVDMPKTNPMDSVVFASMLRASLSHWRQQGKKGIWIKLPIELANLVEPAIKEGFRYHHAELDYLMLVHWIPETADTIPANASHRVGVGAFIFNDKREVLVVKEKTGGFKNKDVWKLPTGVVEEGEHIADAAIREVKEETGIDADFVEVLCFRQSHKAFHRKTDLFFVCMLRACNFNIKVDSEIEDAQWMAAEEYASQEYVRERELFDYVAQICLAKSENNYTGFTPLPTSTSSGKVTYLYCNHQDFQPSKNRP